MNQPRATLAAGMQVTPSVRLLRPLGAGGMGAVWLADHTALNTRVVVKFMLGGGLDSSTSARNRFKKEAEAASQVKSPHVVQTFDYGVTAEGVPFIVMEHLEGRDLAAEIAARGALDPASVITIITQVAKALSKAHAAGLLHRDIKPDNIFLCEVEANDDLFVKLLDFGIAKTHTADGEGSLDGETKTGQVVGTPFYMSPEQVTAQKTVDLRSDLWSLGIVAFEALTGKRPYDGPSFGALAVKIATGEPPKPSDANPALPPSVDAWFAQACAREPRARFASARELAEKLRAAFEGVVSLPPIASGGMGDSGPRGKLHSDPNAATALDERVATPPHSALPSGPISVDDDARSRPSFVLASTLNQDSGGERTSLARSEPGGAAVALPDPSEAPPTVRSGPPSRGAKLVVSVVALVVVVFAVAVGWKARDRTDGGGTAIESATAKNASTRGGGGPPASPPDTAPATAPSVTPMAPPSSVALTEDAGLHVTPSAHLPAVHAPTAHPPTAASSVKPPTTAPHPSTRPNDDPLF